MTHPYDPAMTERAHAAQIVLRRGAADPLELLAAVVWPSERFHEEREQREREQAREREEEPTCAA